MGSQQVPSAPGEEEGLGLPTGLCEFYIPAGCSSNSVLCHCCSSHGTAIPALGASLPGPDSRADPVRAGAQGLSGDRWWLG